MAGFPTVKGSWPWAWIGSYCIPSCITRRPLSTHQMSLKSKKLFVDRRTDRRTFETQVESTRSSRPNKTSGGVYLSQSLWKPVTVVFTNDTILYETIIGHSQVTLSCFEGEFLDEDEVSSFLFGDWNYKTYNMPKNSRITVRSIITFINQLAEIAQWRNG